MFNFLVVVFHKNLFKYLTKYSICFFFCASPYVGGIRTKICAFLFILLDNSKKTGKGKRLGKGGNRYFKSIALGFKTPREATDDTYIDKKCPFTGNVSIRGRILAGTCHSAKMNRTIIVRRNYLHYVMKYQRQELVTLNIYEKRHSNIPAHISPCFLVKEGDHVIIGQCRPLSKTVRFNVLKVVPAGSAGGEKKAFTGM
ncbi:small ribosomal subunit protein uS17-like [Lycium ferocissimum]|uniref:small ribosomal subunit protein uS17-like n=1 Tax=Lycium ferocissimum TaxID=112874 RepID=UPI00281620FB|nr:small ribosomal subunit protein uS17-like [Lycium ferocissimum]